MMNRAYALARFVSIVRPETDPSRPQTALSLLPLAAFYSIFAGAITLGLYFIRAPLGGPGGPVFLFYWLEAVALIGAAAIPAAVRPGSRRYLVWFLGALTAFLGAGILTSLVWLVIIPSAAAALLVFAGAVRVSRGRLPAIIATMASLSLASCYFFQINAMGYGNVFLPERVLSGGAYPDTLYHIALSSIAVWHGKVASSLDGFVPFRYHIFSHIWFGLSAKAAGINTVNGYYLGMQVLGMPLLLFGLCFATLAFIPIQRTTPTAALLVTIPLAVLCTIDRYDWMSYLVSESYMVGLLLFLVGQPFLRSLADSDSYAIPDLASGLVYGLLLTTAKISIGAVWTVAFLYIVIRSRALSKPGYALLGAFLALQAYIVLAFTLPNDNVSTTAFDVLHFVRSYPIAALANFLPISIATALCIGDLRKGIPDRWSEVSLLILLVTALPTLMLRIEGGSAYYFVNIGTWFAIATVSARVIAWIQPRHFAAVLAVSTVWIVAAIALHPEKSTSYGRLKQQTDALYYRLDPAKGSAIFGRSLFDPEALKALADKSAQSTGAKIGKLLEDMHVTAGTNAIVMVAPEFQAYWALTPQCNAAPFLIPSYFGLPLLKGLPPLNKPCDLGTYYGYALYGTSSHSTDMDDANLCRLARSKGFNIIAILRSEQDASKLDCTGR
jgi:hypothetical protein